MACQLSSGGEVNFRWANSATSVTFEVARSLVDAAGTQSPFVAMPFNGTRPFVDATVPVGTLKAFYRVRATRAGRTGPWSEPALLQYVAGGATGAAEFRIAA